MALASQIGGAKAPLPSFARTLIKKEKFIPFPKCAKKHTTAKEALKDIPANAPNNEKIKISSKVKRKLELIPEGCNYEALKGTPFEMKDYRSNIYRRLDRNKPSYTVIASGGGGTWGYHYEEPRPLTNRERARLQGFPDDYVFVGNVREVRKQIGNAVPPAGIYPVAKKIESFLNMVKNN